MPPHVFFFLPPSSCVTFYSNLTDVEVMMPSAARPRRRQTCVPHYLRALIEIISILLSRLMMDEPAHAGAFDKPLSAVTGGTERMKAGSHDRADTHPATCRQTTDDSRWSEERIVKKDRRSICGIDNAVSAPRWGDVTGWQVGRCCLCR